jgi:hypothetical protein
LRFFKHSACQGLWLSTRKGTSSPNVGQSSLSHQEHFYPDAGLGLGPVAAQGVTVLPLRSMWEFTEVEQYDPSWCAPGFVPLGWRAGATPVSFAAAVASLSRRPHVRAWAALGRLGGRDWRACCGNRRKPFVLL